MIQNHLEISSKTFHDDLFSPTHFGGLIFLGTKKRHINFYLVVLYKWVVTQATKIEVVVVGGSASVREVEVVEGGGNAEEVEAQIENEGGGKNHLHRRKSQSQGAQRSRNLLPPNLANLLLR